MTHLNYTTTGQGKQKNAHFDQIHYKIYVCGSADVKRSIGIDAGPQPQLLANPN